MQSVNVEILINGKKYVGELKEVKEAAAGTTTSGEERNDQFTIGEGKEFVWDKDTWGKPWPEETMTEEQFRSGLYSGNSKSSDQ